MDVMIFTKACCGFASVVSGFVSCVYWYRSSKADVLLSSIPPGVDDIGIEVGGREIAVFASSRLQSLLGSKGALSAATAAVFQLIPWVIDTWAAVTAPV
jgi:hypothetical protein